MFHEFEAIVTVGQGGRVEITLPNAEPGLRVKVAVRDLSDDDWVTRLGQGTLRGPSLSNEAITRDSIYGFEQP